MADQASRRNELEVVSVNMCPRAQRRLRRHAAAAIDQTGSSGAFVLDDCVDLDAGSATFTEAAAVGSRSAAIVASLSSDEDERTAEDNARVQVSGSSSSSSAPVYPRRAAPNGQCFPDGRPRRAAPLHRGGETASEWVSRIRRAPPARDGSQAADASSRPATARRIQATPETSLFIVPEAVTSDYFAGRGERHARSRSPMLAPSPSPATGATTPDMAEFAWMSSRDGYQQPGDPSRPISASRTPSPSLARGVATPDSDDARERERRPSSRTSDPASFFVEPMVRGMEPRRCRSCGHSFALGDLRLGFAQAPGRARLGLHEDYQIEWVHATRCTRRLAVTPQLNQSRVSFSPTVSEADRGRILNGLIDRSRFNRVQGRVAGQPKNWSYRPACMQRWESVLLIAPTRPVRPEAGSSGSLVHNVFAPPITSHLGDVLEQRLLAIMRNAAAMAYGGGEAEETNNGLDNVASQVAIQSMLDIVPVETLARRVADPCPICCEPMRVGQQCRRLPCLHLFHIDCIDPWLRMKGTCPLDKLLLQDMIRQQSIGLENPTLLSSSDGRRSRSPRRQGHVDGRPS